MGLMVGFSLAVLAGYGAARIADRLRSPIARRLPLTPLGAADAGRVRVEAAASSAAVPTHAARELRRPACSDRGDSPTADDLRVPDRRWTIPTYLYYSTFHWQYLVNGYSGFFPPSYRRVVNACANFPDEASIDAIDSHGVALPA